MVFSRLHVTTGVKQLTLNAVLSMSLISSIRIGLRDRFVKFYTEDLVKISRKRTVNRGYRKRRLQAEPISAAQKAEIIEFWKPYRNVEKEIGWFEFYNFHCEDKSKLKYYIPDSIYFTEIDTFFTNARRCEELDDKNLYDLLFYDVNMPRTIVRKIDGFYLDKDYQVITLDQAVDLCVNASNVISKESRLSCGGFGLKFFDFSSCNVEEFKKWLSQKKNDNINIQEVVSQHESLNKIHRNSINTLRIISLMFDGEVHVLSALLRMGVDGAKVDNASSGGLMCGIDEKGYLKDIAFGNYGEKVMQHPQGTVFNEVKIIGLEKCYEVIRKVAGRMCSASRLVSWDFAIGADGEPILIEVNLTYGGVNMHQMCNGPVFGDLTERVLARVYKNQ